MPFPSLRYLLYSNINITTTAAMITPVPIMAPGILPLNYARTLISMQSMGYSRSVKSRYVPFDPV